MSKLGRAYRYGFGKGVTTFGSGCLPAMVLILMPFAMLLGILI